MATRRQRQLQAVEVQVLRRDGLLQLILRFVGAGQHLFVASISRRWRTQYRQLLANTYRQEHKQLLADSTWTSYSSVFGSKSRLQLECQHDLQQRFGVRRRYETRSLEFGAGKHADVQTL